VRSIAPPAAPYRASSSAIAVIEARTLAAAVSTILLSQRVGSRASCSLRKLISSRIAEVAPGLGGLPQREPALGVVDIGGRRAHLARGRS